MKSFWGFKRGFFQKAPFARLLLAFSFSIAFSLQEGGAKKKLSKKKRPFRGVAPEPHRLLKKAGENFSAAGAFVWMGAPEAPRQLISPTAGGQGFLRLLYHILLFLQVG